MSPFLLTFYSDPECTKPNTAGLYFRGGKNAEVAGTSGVVKAGWVRYGARWGNATIRVVASASATRALGESDPRQDYYPLPSGTRFVTVEGRRDHAGVMVAVDLLQQAL